MYQLCHKNTPYVLAIWKSIRSVRSLRAKYIRSYFPELTRILNHIMQLQRMRLMLRADSIFMGFEEREVIMNFMNVFQVHGYMQLYFRPGE